MPLYRLCVGLCRIMLHCVVACLLLDCVVAFCGLIVIQESCFLTVRIVIIGFFIELQLFDYLFNKNKSLKNNLLGWVHLLLVLSMDT